ncbi:MAG: DUF4198 domain-containing protein [Planctomycetota bacterium]
MQQRKTVVARMAVGGAVFLGLSAVALAHFPMTLTPEPMTEPGQPVEFLITNGHPFMNDRFDAPRPDRVGVLPPERRFRDLSGEKYLSKVKTPQGTEAYLLRYTPESAGDWIFSFHTGEVREKPNRRVADYVKLVLHVRHETGAQIGWRRVIGDPLEIVPYTRPYALPVGTAFRGRVVYNRHSGPRGRDITSVPLIEGVVEAECFTPDKRPGWAYLPENRLAVQTDERGYFTVTLPQEGWWMLSCATDGGPGEQGLTPILARRAVLWLYAGRTVWDRAREQEAKRQAGAKPAPRAKGTEVTCMIYSGRPNPTFAIKDPKELQELQEKLQNLLLAGPEVKLGPLPLGGLAFNVDTDALWDVSSVTVRPDAQGVWYLEIRDDDGKVAVYRDINDLAEFLVQRARAAKIELPAAPRPTSRPAEKKTPATDEDEKEPGEGD